MSLLPKQPEALINEFRWSDKLLPGQFMTSPFFFEWVFCSDLGDGESSMKLGPNLKNLSATFHNARLELENYSNDCEIIKYSIMQYKLLKGEFRAIEKEYAESLKIIECCFNAATLYWDVIKKYLIENTFENADHEIYFFKVIKPLFISETDFLSLAYHALLFTKATDKDEKFWEREKQRKDKLLLEHPAFFNSYLNGYTEQDDVWFKRTKRADQCSHDHLVTSWFAIRRYEVFIESAILQSTKLNN